MKSTKSMLNEFDDLAAKARGNIRKVATIAESSDLREKYVDEIVKVRQRLAARQVPESEINWYAQRWGDYILRTAESV